MTLSPRLGMALLLLAALSCRRVWEGATGCARGVYPRQRLPSCSALFRVSLAGGRARGLVGSPGLMQTPCEQT